MKRALIAAAAAAALSSPAPGQAAPQGAACDRTAKELEAKISHISQNLDRAAFEQFVAEDVSIINAAGEKLSKKQQTDSFNIPPGVVLTFRTSDMKTLVCAETSIVTHGKDTVEVREKGKTEGESQSWWFTRVYEKRRGRWQLILNQLTSISD